MPLLRWLKAGAEFVAVILLAAMFSFFILQIFSRYVLNEPLSWTLEACLISWLWVVFWGCGVLLRDNDHVKFDILYQGAPNQLRRVFALVSAAAVIVAFIATAPATYDYISFMKIERSSSLKIRLDYIFSIYLLFMAGAVVYYGARIIRILKTSEFEDRAHLEKKE
jgi:C4-dicarboxylate transporter DctQ subunit